MENSRFHEFLGASSVNGVPERDWQVLEARAGVTLPDDYKNFVSAYGPGVINDQLYLFHPRAAGGQEGLPLELLWEQAADTYASLSEELPDLYPYAVYPEPGGYIPVARSTSGNYVFLAPPVGEGARWSVVIEMGEWIRVDLSFTDFLYGLLCGDLDIPMLDGDPSFELIGTVEPS